MFTTIRHELRHARKAWPGIQPLPSLCSVRCAIDCWHGGVWSPLWCIVGPLLRSNVWCRPEGLLGVATADCWTWNWGEWRLQKYIWKGSFFGWFVGFCCAGTRDFCPAFAFLDGPVQNIFLLTGHYSISLDIYPLPSKLGRQSCRIAYLLISVSTANEGTVRIPNKCLVPNYVFPEMKRLFPELNYIVLPPSSYTHIPVRDFYISRISLLFCCREMWTNPENIYINCSQTLECGKWDWGRTIPRKEIHKWGFPCSVWCRLRRALTEQPFDCIAVYIF
jgi:hypothetical protein